MKLLFKEKTSRRKTWLKSKNICLAMDLLQVLPSETDQVRTKQQQLILRAQEPLKNII